MSNWTVAMMSTKRKSVLNELVRSIQSSDVVKVSWSCLRLRHSQNAEHVQTVETSRARSSLQNQNEVEVDDVDERRDDPHEHVPYGVGERMAELKHIVDNVVRAQHCTKVGTRR